MSRNVRVYLKPVTAMLDPRMSRHLIAWGYAENADQYDKEQKEIELVKGTGTTPPKGVIRDPFAELNKD